MDMMALWTGAGGFLISAIYFIPKLRKYKADTESTTVGTLETALQSLSSVYETKLQVVQSTYEIEIGGIKKQHDRLQLEVDLLRKKQIETERLYLADSDTLIKVRKAAKAGETCSNYPECPIKKVFHELGGKL